ncbi:site-specific integrase [Candidatus Daviesbacteria bacterium]|nr:site-specific integrase [Candidatus Daviesbacteria bacterium]
MLLSKLITDFLEYLELKRNASQLTIRNYDHYLKRFLEFAKDIDPKDIDLNLIRKYRRYLSRYTDPKTGKILKTVTRNYFMIALRAFLRYLARIDIPSLSYKRVELEEAERSPAKVLDNNQLESLLNAPDTAKKEGLRDKAILETLG